MRHLKTFQTPPCVLQVLCHRMLNYQIPFGWVLLENQRCYELLIWIPLWTIKDWQSSKSNVILVSYRKQSYENWVCYQTSQIYFVSSKLLRNSFDPAYKQVTIDLLLPIDFGWIIFLFLMNTFSCFVLVDTNSCRALTNFFCTDFSLAFTVMEFQNLPQM